MDDTGSAVAFWMLSMLTVGSALGVAVVRNLVQSVVFLVVTFLGVAGLFVLLSADFLAVAQVLIYAGAISVLIIFAIMLTPRAERNNAETFFHWPALLVAGSLLVTIAAIILTTEWSETGQGLPETASVIGEALLNKYVLPFEIASVLLLIAMLGAILLVQEDE